MAAERDLLFFPAELDSRTPAYGYLVGSCLPSHNVEAEIVKCLASVHWLFLPILSRKIGADQSLRLLAHIPDVFLEEQSADEAYTDTGRERNDDACHRR